MFCRAVSSILGSPHQTCDRASIHDGATIVQHLQLSFHALHQPADIDVVQKVPFLEVLLCNCSEADRLWYYTCNVRSAIKTSEVLQSS